MMGWNEICCLQTAKVIKKCSYVKAVSHINESVVNVNAKKLQKLSAQQLISLHSLQLRQLYVSRKDNYSRT